MPGCKPIVKTIEGTNREKWEYVRTFYFGDREETRDASDPARIEEELYLDTTFLEDQGEWTANYSHVPFEKFMQWYYEMGTYKYGNLPDWKQDDHVGHSYATCPYDSASSDVRTRIMLGLEITDSLPTRNAHGDYYLQTESRGSRWGYKCTFSGCPYYTTYGRRYFYV